jgi:hypothetical protein
MRCGTSALQVCTPIVPIDSTIIEFEFELEFGQNNNCKSFFEIMAFVL